jgi:hypothetical protein
VFDNFLIRERLLVKDGSNQAFQSPSVESLHVSGCGGSHKISGDPSVGGSPLVVGDCLIYDDVSISIGSQLEDGCLIRHSVHVIRCRPNGEELFAVEVILKALNHDLMRARDQLESVELAELNNRAPPEK